MTVKWAVDGETLRPGTVYVAPQNSEIRVASRGRLHVTACERGRFGTPAGDPLFESISIQFGSRSIAVVLTGLLRDGAAGVQAIKRQGGTVLIQDPRTALAQDMPRAAACTRGLHFVIPLNRISITLGALAVIGPAYFQSVAWCSSAPCKSVHNALAAAEDMEAPVSSVCLNLPPIMIEDPVELSVDEGVALA